ncbi:MAG TPA: glycerol-3-phosphate dehydrogenase/oxidase [Pilimelia sp.]|nr:glycerol-3-phosphate dehydrogenase/oxidase [Pilimelia sp.]
MSGHTSLSAARRARDLAELADGVRVDVLVVGLGVTGAGVALDAAARGLSVAAVDAHDLAFGTSRWSSKLVHGGLRYLISGDVSLAYESAVERDILLRRTAPHLVTPLPFALALTPFVSPTEARLARAGIAAADVLRAVAGTPRAYLPRPRRATAAELRRLVPRIRRDGLRGALVHWESQLVDDARLVVALARTAAGHGARILTGCRVQRLRGDGADVVVSSTGETVRIRARSVVNATGVWAGQLDPSIRLRPSRGTHVVLAPGALGHPASALSILVPGTVSRFVVALPQPDGRIYAGLTDEPVDAVEDVPTPTPDEIGFLLAVLNTAIAPSVTPADVIGAFAGLRPLLAGTGDRTADLSRRHAVRVSPDGVVTVVGGKLTTYRRMASDAVDAAVATAGLAAGPCRTHRLPLVGAAPPGLLSAVAAPARLVARYGTEAPDILALAAGDPGLLRPIADGLDVTGAELVWAVRHEGARDESDLLDRRTRVGLVPADRERALPAAHAVLAREGIAAELA